MVGPDMVRLLAAGGLVVLLACLVSFAELLAAHCCGLGLQSGIHACWQMLSCTCLELMAVAGLHTGLADWLSLEGCCQCWMFLLCCCCCLGIGALAEHLCNALLLHLLGLIGRYVLQDFYIYAHITHTHTFLWCSIYSEASTKT